MRRKSNPVYKLIVMVLSLVFICEYMVYYIVISQCSWPILKKEQSDNTIELEPDGDKEVVKVMIIADIHLLGSLKGNWFDRLRREWQVYRSFQTAMALFKPEIIFILGDIFDEGLRCSDYEFQYYVNKLNSIFHVPEGIKIFFVPGNHDIGYHYDITPHLHDRFAKALNSPPVQLVSVRENNFVLINSMAMEGDGCFICRPAQIEINNIANKLRCAKGIGKCPFKTTIKQFSRPILIQHFPMYRSSDRQCSEPDQAPEDIKKQEFHERWDTLSKEASEMIYDNLKPRVIVAGHTHHGCHVVHRQDIHEYTLPSFNWRKKNNPSFILGIFLPNNYAINKCHVPQESTVVFLYCLGGFFISLWVLLWFKSRPLNLYRYQRK